MVFKPEKVLTNEAITKLQKYNLLNDNLDDMANWKIQLIWFDMIFPYIKFYDGIIPETYNQPSFLIYLGFMDATAFEIFYKVIENGAPTKEKLMNFAKTHINVVYSNSNQNWASVGSLLANSLMEDMGLNEAVREEVNKLYEAFQRSPLVFQRYFDENHDKNFENLKLVDFVQELLYQRMQKLMALSKASVQYLP